MARKLKAPRHPQIFGDIVATLRIMSGERAAETDRERSIMAALGNGHEGRAKRLVTTLEKTPPSARKNLLGHIADKGFRIADVGAPAEPAPAPPADDNADRYTWTYARHALENTVNRGEVEERASEHSSDLPTFTIRYRGLFCQNETGHNNSGSDEIYVITSAVHVTAGDNTIRTERHPIQAGARYYSGVDNNEERVGPVAAVWHGKGTPVSLVVVVMEHDYGDPDKFKDEIDTVVTVAVKIIKFFYGVDVGVIKDTVVDALNWFLDTDDDIVTTETKVLEFTQLEELTRYPPAFYYNAPRNNPTEILHHFVTSHSSDDANYIVCFTVERDPSHEQPRGPEP